MVLICTRLCFKARLPTSIIIDSTIIIGVLWAVGNTTAMLDSSTSTLGPRVTPPISSPCEGRFHDTFLGRPSPHARRTCHQFRQHLTIPQQLAGQSLACVFAITFQRAMLNWQQAMAFEHDSQCDDEQFRQYFAPSWSGLLKIFKEVPTDTVGNNVSRCDVQLSTLRI